MNSDFHDRRAAVLGAVIATSFAAVTGTLAGNLEASITQVTSTAGGGVEALVLVVDENRRPVTGLSGTNFAVAVDGVPITGCEIARVSEPMKRIAVVLAIDVSGSMRGDPLQKARHAASALVASLEEHDLCAILAFGQGVHQITGFTESKADLLTALQQLNASDANTFMNAAIYDAASQAATSPIGRASVVILTDGIDEGSPITLDDAIHHAVVQSVTVFPIGFGSKTRPDLLRRLAFLTGGIFVEAPSPDDLPTVYQRALEQLKTQYALRLPAGRVAAGKHRIAIQVASRGSTVAGEREFDHSIVAESPQTAGDYLGGSTTRQWSIVVGLLVTLAAGIALFLRRRRGVAIHASSEKSADLRGDSSGTTGHTGTALDSVASSTAPPVRDEWGRAASMVWLDIVAGPLAGTRVELCGKTVNIGRGSTEDIRLLDDREISRHHAEVIPVGTRYAIVDCSSHNGTFLNDHQVFRETLHTNDHIRVGQTELVFQDHR